MARQPLEKDLIVRMVGDLNKASDKSVILKILTKIRSDLSKSKSGIKIFREAEGFYALIPFIKRPSKRIIDLALSILANCCTDEDCVQEVMKLNVIPALILLLKTIPNQAILCRTCRLLGNLATDKKNAKAIQDGNLVTALVSLLDEQGNEQEGWKGTLLMITRLIGKMWRLDSFQVDAYLYGIIKRITLALIKLSETKDPKNIPPPPESTSTAPNEAFNPKRLQRESNQVFNSMENNHEQSSIEAFQRVASNKSTIEEPKTDQFTLPTKTSEREVTSCLLKCILMAASSKTYQFTEQIISNPISLRCLLFYCQGESPFRAVALHIMSSLSFNPSVRYAIGSANGVDVILNLLKNSSEDLPTLTDSEYKYCMNVICLLAGDSCNRAKIRYCGGMRILLKRFRDTTNASERNMILFGLSIFANDQMSVNLLVREGLINTLLHRMAIELDALGEYHMPVAIKRDDQEKVAPLKRKSSKLEAGNKLKRQNYGRMSPSGAYSDSAESPSSCSGYGSMSNRSPSYSSYSSPPNADFDSDADSATYSPVCSDAEDHIMKKEEEVREKVELSEMYDEVEDVAEEDTEPVEEETVFLLPADEEDAMASEKVEDEEADIPQEMKLWNKSVIKKMLVLLKDMRLRIRRVPDLAKGENLSVLLRACKSIPEPVQFCQLILSFIVQDTENFVNLMQTNFIIDLYNLRHPTVAHRNCRLCADMRSISVQVLENVSTIAESGYGRGELAHYLLTGEMSTQKHVALVTALVVRDPKFLYSLLFEHNALKIVMEEIMDASEGARSAEACLGITSLARNLKLFLEDDSKDRNTAEREEEEPVRGGDGSLELSDFPMKTESDSKITFVLSDGERIVFNEEILTSYSEVFNSMFSRDFQESKFKEVVINDVSAGGLKYFLQLVQHFQRNPEPNYAHIPKTEQITWALEAYELSIMYMLGDIERNVLRHIKKLVDDTSVQDMLEWSMKNNNADMLEMSIYYFLNSDLSGPRKLKMFRRANESVYSKEWNNWIVDTIKTRCRAALGLITLTE